jgi:hypothetical protein
VLITTLLYPQLREHTCVVEMPLRNRNPSCGAMRQSTSSVHYYGGEDWRNFAPDVADALVARDKSGLDRPRPRTPEDRWSNCWQAGFLTSGAPLVQAI